MARKKKTEVLKDIPEELLEEVFEEVREEIKEVPKSFYKIQNANRLRLRLEAGTLDGAGFEDVTIEKYDMRTVPLAGCVMTGSTFKDVNMQGCNMAETIEVVGNTFIDCDLRWGRKPEGFEGNNTFINTRL